MMSTIVVLCAVVVVILVLGVHTHDTRRDDGLVETHVVVWGSTLLTYTVKRTTT